MNHQRNSHWDKAWVTRPLSKGNHPEKADGLGKVGRREREGRRKGRNGLGTRWMPPTPTPDLTRSLTRLCISRAGVSLITTHLFPARPSLYGTKPPKVFSAGNPLRNVWNPGKKCSIIHTCNTQIYSNLHLSKRKPKYTLGHITRSNTLLHFPPDRGLF